MPQPLLLRTQVAYVRGRDRDFEGDSLRHTDPVAFQFLNFRRVVRHEPHGRHTEDAQHARRALVVPEIRGESEDSVRVDRIEAMVLEVVCGHLVCDANPSPLLGHVEQDAAGCPANSLQRCVKLLAAIAPFGTEDIARHAFGVEAHEDVPLSRDVALDERDVLLPRERADKCVNPEMAVPSRQPRLAPEEDIVAQLSFEAGHRRRVRQSRRI